MKTSSSLFRIALVLSVAIGLPVNLAAQKGGKGGGSTGRPTITPGISPTTSTQPAATQPLFISGKVMVDGGGVLPEPVVIERVCNGVARRQGYSDGKGSFQFQLDQNPGFQDASENTSSIFSNDVPPTTQAQDALKMKYQGCEIRAVLPGFLSSAVPLRLEGNSWQYDVGTIVLKRMENVTGATISMTTLNAPGGARHAYEKGRKDFNENRLADAEKELNKAVKLYPGFAAAWSLLGDIHQQQKQFDLAIKEYSQALSADPQYLNPEFGLALIALQEKRWQDAVQLTDQVTKMNAAAFPSAYFYNAVANYNLGRIDPAEESARKFKSLDSEHRHPDICLLLSQILIHKRDYPGAARELRDYLALVPGAPNAEETRVALHRLEQAMVAKQQ